MVGGLLAVVAWCTRSGLVCSWLQRCQPAGCCHGCSLARGAAQWLLPLGSPYPGRFCVDCQYGVPSILCADFFWGGQSVSLYLAHIFCVWPMSNWKVSGMLGWSVHGLLARSVTGLCTVCRQGLSSRSVYVVCAWSVCGCTKNVFFSALCSFRKKVVETWGCPNIFPLL